MACLPYDPTLTIEVVLPASLDRQGAAVVNVTVKESEELTFGFLLEEAVQLLRIQEPAVTKELRYVFGLRNSSGLIIERSRSLFQVCEIMFDPTFTIVTEGPLNSLVSDTMLCDIVSWLGLSVQSLGCLFMFVSRRWKRIFGSSRAWSQVELNFPFIGTSAGDCSSYTKQLHYEAGLPRIAKLKVIHISLVSPRLRIWLGQEHESLHSSTSKGGILSWFSSVFTPSINTKPALKNTVVVVGESIARTESLHEAFACILPESSMKVIACPNAAGIDAFNDVNVQFGYNNKNHNHADARFKVLGDERLFIVTGDAQTCLAILSAVGYITTIDVNLLPDSVIAEDARIRAAIAQLLVTFSRSNGPFVIFLAITDLEQHPQLLAHAIKSRMHSISSILSSLLEGRSAKRGYWLQPYDPTLINKKHGFIAGVNWLLRAISPLYSRS